MNMQPDIEITNDFLPEQETLFRALIGSVEWDQRMRARKTASFGVPYRDAQIDYDAQPLPDALAKVRDDVAEQLGWEPNHLLLDYFPQRRSATGMHVEKVEHLDPDTGIAIVSLGATRIMVFERIEDGYMCGRELPPGSLMVMDLPTQALWRHGMPARPGVGPRINITFRKLVAAEMLQARTGT